ncbi:hypothetical protein [Companilactobacillus furfuricola]|uniref:hypothetical protein n=1 Tax=Companilactobacillus furfuricola TaxID=1462575 RepID=UPI001B8810D4|nr:hypothetical protein [Companilactobacillus furfuricola]
MLFYWVGGKSKVKFEIKVNVVVWLYVQCRFRVGALYGTGTLPTRFELLEEERFDDLKYESSSKLLRGSRRGLVILMHLFKKRLIYSMPIFMSI